MNRGSYIVFALIALASRGSIAQSPGVSNAVVLVQPAGMQAIVAVTFPSVVSHAQVKARFERLKMRSGWTVSDLKIVDREVRLGDVNGAKSIPVKQTEATAFLANAPQINRNAFLIQPYLEAFSDLARFELMFVVKPASGFQGLRTFETPPVSVTLQSDTGLYRYLIEIRDHSKPMPTLPLTQVLAPISPGSASVPAQRPETTRRVSALALVVAIGAGAAFLALVGWLLVLRVSSARGLDKTRRINNRPNKHAKAGRR